MCTYDDRRCRFDDLFRVARLAGQVERHRLANQIRLGLRAFRHLAQTVGDFASSILDGVEKPLVVLIVRLFEQRQLLATGVDLSLVCGQLLEQALLLQVQKRQVVPVCESVSVIRDDPSITSNNL